MASPRHDSRHDRRLLRLRLPDQAAGGGAPHLRPPGIHLQGARQDRRQRPAGARPPRLPRPLLVLVPRRNLLHVRQDDAALPPLRAQGGQRRRRQRPGLGAAAAAAAAGRCGRGRGRGRGRGGGGWRPRRLRRPLRPPSRRARLPRVALRGRRLRALHPRLHGLCDRAEAAPELPVPVLAVRLLPHGPPLCRRPVHVPRGECLQRAHLVLRPLRTRRLQRQLRIRLG